MTLLLLSNAGSVAIQGALFVLFVAVSATFSAARVCLHNSPAYYRRNLPAGKGASEAAASPTRPLIAVRLVEHLANAGAIVTLLVLSTQLVGSSGGLVALSAGVLGALVLALFGELLPRAWASRGARASAERMRPWIAGALLVGGPIVGLLEHLAPRADEGSTLQQRVIEDEAELETLVEAGADQDVIEEGQREMISAVFDFGEETVNEAMVPRTDIVAIEASTPAEEMAALVNDSGYSRIPVYRDDLDSIVGVVYGKDVLAQLRTGGKATAAEIMKEALFVPETATLDETLRDMKTRRVHIAIVHDEFGGTAGLITLEDLLEEIVGEIYDEYDPEAQTLEVLDPREVILDARMAVEEVNEELGTDLPEDAGYETLGGFLFHKLGRPGREDETVEVDGLEFTLERVVNRRIIKVRVALPEALAIDTDEE